MTDSPASLWSGVTVAVVGVTVDVQEVYGGLHVAIHPFSTLQSDD